MDDRHSHTGPFRHPYVRTPDTESLIARDRALLYIRGMDIDAVHSVELALKSLRRSQSLTADTCGEEMRDDQADHETARVMTALFAITEEMSIPLFMTDGQGNRLVSAPPMNRRPMIAGPIDNLSLFSGIRRFASALREKLSGGAKTGTPGREEP